MRRMTKLTNEPQWLDENIKVRATPDYVTLVDGDDVVLISHESMARLVSLYQEYRVQQQQQ